MSSWLHRTRKEFLARMSPASMRERYPLEGPFVGRDGNAISNALWIHRPDRSEVVGLPVRHWKIEKDAVKPMSESERATVDAQLEAERAAKVYVL